MTLQGTKMEEATNRPIFVVGSPRSGTSVLTWCLGQHENILAVDESTGLGDLALAIAACHERKMGLQPGSLWTALSVPREEFFTAFGKTLNELIQRHRIDLEKKRWEQVFTPNNPPHSFPIKGATYYSKTRWVDGTPLYSFYIYGLHKLFPNARFIHIVRDVTSVVRSLLNFHRLGGVKLVSDVEQAYELWCSAVRACVLAEQAYGPEVLFRLRYLDLVNQPEPCLRGLLDFLGERYDDACLVPLQEKINSSNVPADFQIGDATRDPDIIRQAMQLQAEMETIPQASEPSPAAASELEATFYERARQGANQLLKIQARAERLAKEVKRKRAFIQQLRASHRRYNLWRLLGYKSSLLLSCVSYLTDGMNLLDWFPVAM